MLPEEIERHQRSKNICPELYRMNLMIQNLIRKIHIGTGSKADVSQRSRDSVVRRKCQPQAGGGGSGFVLANEGRSSNRANHAATFANCALHPNSGHRKSA